MKIETSAVSPCDHSIVACVESAWLLCDCGLFLERCERCRFTKQVQVRGQLVAKVQSQTSALVEQRILRLQEKLIEGVAGELVRLHASAILRAEGETFYRMWVCAVQNLLRGVRGRDAQARQDKYAPPSSVCRKVKARCLDVASTLGSFKAGPIELRDKFANSLTYRVPMYHVPQAEPRLPSAGPG